MLCTANVCRSPMAAALLARELAARGGGARVRSAGTRRGIGSPPPEVVTVMAGYGLDLTGHRSRAVTADDLVGADLIVAMTREHLRQAVVIGPQAWPRSFTIRELIRRGDLAGARRPGETLSGWLARVHAGRTRMALLGASPRDDVADPIGGPLSGYAQTAATLHHLARRLADLSWPAQGPGD